MRRFVVLHPLLWAAFPVLFLYSHNQQELRFESVLGPLAIIPAIAAGAWLVLGALWRDRARAALVVSILLVGFFSYGHVYLWLEQTGVARHRFLMPAWLLGMGASILGVACARRALEVLTRLAFTVAAVLILTSSAGIVATSSTGSARPQGLAGLAARDPVLPARPAGERPPDIYYILLDAYGGEESLTRYFDYDNRGFLERLEARGFFVAHRSRANYMITHLAMAASLNMSYVDSLTDRIGTDSRNLHVLNALIRDNRVARVLARRGYTIEFIQSPADLSARDFPNLLMQTTMVAYWSNIEHHRRRTLEAFDALERLPVFAQPRFVYAHVICPHGPYVFGPDGERLQGLEWKRTLTGEKGMRARYIGQLQFVNTRVEKIVSGILARSTTPPVIILQGDHGPIAGENLEHLTPGLLGQRAPILNAVYLPGGSEGLPDDLSPVNNFRVVLDRVFGARLPMLPNETFYSHGKRPYRLTRVTDRVRPDPDLTSKSVSR